MIKVTNVVQRQGLLVGGTTPRFTHNNGSCTQPSLAMCWGFGTKLCVDALFSFCSAPRTTWPAVWFVSTAAWKCWSAYCAGATTPSYWPLWLGPSGSVQSATRTSRGAVITGVEWGWDGALYLEAHGVRREYWDVGSWWNASKYQNERKWEVMW